MSNCIDKQKPGRPKAINDPVTYKLVLPEADHKKLKRIANETGISNAELIRQILRSWLKQHEGD